MSDATAIRLTGVEKTYGLVTALHALDLEIGRGEFFTLVGPSGCGKTTLLRMIAGLVSPTGGRIEIDGETVFDAAAAREVGPEHRNIGLVFQNYALWPHMTVFQNVAFGLAGRPKAEIRERVTAELANAKIDGLEERFPSELSGGQQQRVALARELVTGVDVVLMDEPLSNLDARLRIDMRSELKALHQRTGKTIVYVTHDQIEAMTMSTTMVVMKDGRIAQMGNPQAVYENPDSLFVAEFIGHLPLNVLEGTADATGTIAGDGWKFSDLADAAGQGDVTVGFRPEAVHLLPRPDAVPLNLEVISVLPAGAYEILHCQIQQHPDRSIYIQAHEPHGLRTGNATTGWISRERALVFDRTSGARIRRPNRP